MTKATATAPRPSPPFNAEPRRRRGQSYAEAMEITPAIASAWLERDARDAEQQGVRFNRRPNVEWIDKLAHDMSNDQWFDTGEPIILDWDDRVRDGGQRLAAVVRSGRTIRFQVVRGVDPASQDLMDKNRKRTIADDMFRRGVPNSNVVAATAALVVHWRTGQLLNKKFGPTAIEVHRFEQANALELQAASRGAASVTSRLSTGTNTVFAAAWFESMKIDPEAAQTFFNAVATGESLEPLSPLLALRNTIIRYGNLPRKPHRHHQLYQVVHAWNLWRAGRTAQFLRVPSGLSSDQFPVMK